jgi:hypothetical protein
MTFFFISPPVMGRHRAGRAACLQLPAGSGKIALRMPMRVLVVPVSGLAAAPPSQLFRVANAETDRGDVPEQTTVAPRVGDLRAPCHGVV